MVASPEQARATSPRTTPTQASVRVEEHRGTVRIVLGGEIDAEAEASLKRAGDQALARRMPIEVDSRQVSFMDSTGVSFLAVLASRAPVTVTLLDPPEIVRFLVDTTGIAPMVEVRPEVVDVERSPGDHDAAHGARRTASS